MGGNVLRAVAAAGGGALLQLDSGGLLAWSAGAGLARCERGACFGAPCPLMRATPAAALAAPGALVALLGSPVLQLCKPGCLPLSAALQSRDARHVCRIQVQLLREQTGCGKPSTFW